MQQITIRTHLSIETRKSFNRLMTIAKKCVKRGSMALGLAKCQIVGDIFLWKLDEEGFLAIDTNRKEVFGVDGSLHPVENLYPEVLEQLEDVAETLEQVYLRSETVKNIPMVDERFIYLRTSMLSAARRVINLASDGKLEIGESCVVDDMLFIARKDAPYIVISPDSVDAIVYTCADLDPTHLVGENVSFGFYRFLRGIMLDAIASGKTHTVLSIKAEDRSDEMQLNALIAVTEALRLGTEALGLHQSKIVVGRLFIKRSADYLVIWPSAPVGKSKYYTSTTPTIEGCVELDENKVHYDFIFNTVTGWLPK